jgi:DNA-binding SARP family transcriptional activator
MFERELGIDRPERVLATTQPGYVFAVDRWESDVDAFTDLFRRGSRHLNRGEHELADARLFEATALWRGPAFAGIPTGPVLDGHVTYLHEMRLAAIGLRIQAQQLLSRHAEVVPQLRALVARHPLHEGFHAQLIEALGACGRRAEALAAYRGLWRVLDDELGVEPSPRLQRLHQDVLRGGGEVLAHAVAG